MEDFRSKSYKDTRMQVENGLGNYRSGMQNLRSYSANHASSYYSATGAAQSNGSMEIVVAEGGDGGGERWKFKKGRSIGGFSTKSWGFNDPELQRKKRVAGYKVYSVEGKVKGSIKKSFRWVKDKCSQMVHGHT